MSDWINKLKTEDEEKAQMEIDRQHINSQRDDVVNYLFGIAKTNVHSANINLFDGRENCKVEQQCPVEMDDEKYLNDFCVFINSFPNVSYLFVRFDGRRSCITRLLRTVKELDGARDDNELVPLEIGLDDNRRLYIHLNGKRLNDKEIGQYLVAPVVIFHRDGDLRQVE